MDKDQAEVIAPNGIPAYLPPNYALSAKDALAMISGYVFLMAPMAAAAYAVACCFGIADNIPVRDQLHGMSECEFLGIAAIAAICAALVGKYLWLIAMSRVLSQINVGPLVAYGRPRRISHFDRALIERFYRRDTNTIESRLLPPKPAWYLAYCHAGIYGAGAALQACIAASHLMPSDRYPWWLSVFFMSLALFFAAIGIWAQRRKL